MNEEYFIKYTKEYTDIRIWAPKLESLVLRVYKDPYSRRYVEYDMEKKGEDFTYRLNGDMKGCYYTLIVDKEGQIMEVTDPYSIASAPNSTRSCIVDLKETNPDGWFEQKTVTYENITDIVLYEMHVRDTTSHESSPFEHKGLYMGLTESKKLEDVSIGLNHLKELGITHVHLMPVQDFERVDERFPLAYNWGYDPELYNVPEGSYSSTVDDPTIRIKELKEVIKSFHNNGLGVVLDVVYNHTFRGGSSNFHTLNPYYFHRTIDDKYFSNGSGCGNELASEKPMVRKFIIDSLKFWLEEYKVDGFRFDLMALIDVETFELIEKELKRIKPDIILYGEPWMAADTTLDPEDRYTKGKQWNSNISVFNDDLRNGIKGDSDGHKKGFCQGNITKAHYVMRGAVGEVQYSDYVKGFACHPRETVNYIAAHDNLILYDKMLKFHHDFEYDQLIQMNRFAFSLMFLSQGVPFITQGTEFLRSKYGHHNTYNSDDSINGVNWHLKVDNYYFFEYVKDLVAFRKKFKELRMYDEKDVKDRIRFFNLDQSVVSFTIKLDHEDYKYMMVIHNGAVTDLVYPINSNGKWLQVSDGITFFDKKDYKFIEEPMKINGLSSTILLYKK